MSQREPNLIHLTNRFRLSSEEACVRRNMLFLEACAGGSEVTTVNIQNLYGGGGLCVHMIQYKAERHQDVHKESEGRPTAVGSTQRANAELRNGAIPLAAADLYTKQKGNAE